MMVDMPSAHEMPFGAELKADGTVRFRLWAPSHETILLELDDRAQSHAMHPGDDGWHDLVTSEARAGTRYRFVLSDGLRVPDPASRQQAEDVHGASLVVDPAAYVWRDDTWTGRQWQEAVIYELHIGTFTPEGTFREAIGKLGHLADLGVTAIEIMPVAAFPGLWNWGYDGVLPFAPANAYGSPEDLKALVDAAHAAGFMVLLDVVYNHFGPEGAYIHVIAPQAFTERDHTPWGAAIDMQVAPVREFFIHNALFWIEEFHFDGLRLDAVHAILDDGPRHLLNELAERVNRLDLRRPVHLILENEDNEASLLVRGGARPRLFTAQWNDDVHHALHVAATGEADGYYADYCGDTGKLARALAEGFSFQGEVMSYRGGPRGEPSTALPPLAFVSFIQNHDQVGNRAFGERLTAISSAPAVRAAAAVYLLLPQVPMLFMGEEWAAPQPFLFFCDFGAALADAVRDGRRAEFARFPQFRDPAKRQRIPDPMAEATFLSSKLDWSDVGREPHADWLAWYRRALAIRKAEVLPLLSHINHGGRYEIVGEAAVSVRWSITDGRELALAANLSAAPVEGFPTAKGRVLFSEGSTAANGVFGAHSVRWSIRGSMDR
jgi:malto-oligosyltrehalose trehalohydrolase